MRGFKIVVDEHRKNADEDVFIPTRATEGSAGYDFTSPERIHLEAGQEKKVYFDIKAYMQGDELLCMYPRYSTGKRGAYLVNTVGIIDSDYYGNKDNDGNITAILRNISSGPITFEKHEMIVQGIFQKFLTTDTDHKTPKQKRVGGEGSTGRNHYGHHQE